MTPQHDSGRSKKTFLSKAPRIILICAALLQIQSTFSVKARHSGPRRLPRLNARIDTPLDIPSALSSATNATTVVDTTDYCAMAAEASKKAYGVIPYQAAKGCYEMFAFDSDIRDQTLQTVRANLESFYVFYDLAKSPPMMENSDLSPVDLSTSLTGLGQMTFANDYTFHEKLAYLIAQLRDPHTTYKSMCYQQFMFIQPISTYGVYEEGRQQVKVGTVLNKLDARLTRELVDCEVTHIDGVPAFEAITEFAKTKSYSKDRGVRINKSFSYLAHDKTGSPYDRYALGTFAQRTSIPSNATIEYKIDCRAKFESDMRAGLESPPPMTFDLAWTALDATMAPYEDAQSYRRQFCADDSIQIVKRFVLDSASADDFGAVKTQALGGRKKSKELYRGAYASFHMLNDGVTGVFRLGTESLNKLEGVHPNFYLNIDRGFAALDKAGATKLIVDLQNNSGGIICWGRYVLQTLFPSTVDSPYIYSLRASPLAQALAKATFHYDQEGDSPYEGLVDPDTGEEVTTDSWMTPGTRLPGREGNFSNKVTDRFCSAIDDVRGDREDAMFEPKDIVILTNGFCGSTCAVLALQLHERYGVRTVAIGGEHGKSMMFTSFPGGAVQANNTLWVQRVQQVFATLPSAVRNQQLQTLLPKQFSANGQLAFTFRQVMSASEPDQVSEYMRIPSEFRMDYTVARFRMPSILWEDVRDDVWGKVPATGDIDDGQGADEEEEEEETMEDDDKGGLFEGQSQGTGMMVEVEEAVVDEMMQAEMETATREPDREDLEWLQRFEMYK